MTCPNCQQPLPPTHVSATCPACGASLTDRTHSESEPSAAFQVVLACLKVLGWLLVLAVGCVMLVMAVVFAGCVCHDMR